MSTQKLNNILYFVDEVAKTSWNRTFDTEISQILEYSELIVIHLSHDENDILVVFNLQGKELGVIQSPRVGGGGWNGFTAIKKMQGVPPKAEVTCFNGGVHIADFKALTLTLTGFTK